MRINRAMRPAVSGSMRWSRNQTPQLNEPLRSDLTMEDFRAQPRRQLLPAVPGRQPQTNCCRFCCRSDSVRRPLNGYLVKSSGSTPICSTIWRKAFPGTSRYLRGKRPSISRNFQRTASANRRTGELFSSDLRSLVESDHCRSRSWSVRFRFTPRDLPVDRAVREDSLSKPATVKQRPNRMNASSLSNLETGMRRRARSMPAQQSWPRVG